MLSRLPSGAKRYPNVGARTPEWEQEAPAPPQLGRGGPEEEPQPAQKPAEAPAPAQLGRGGAEEGLQPAPRPAEAPAPAQLGSSGGEEARQPLAPPAEAADPAQPGRGEGEEAPRPAPRPEEALRAWEPRPEEVPAPLLLGRGGAGEPAKPEPEPAEDRQHVAATKIQALHRGNAARRLAKARMQQRQLAKEVDFLVGHHERFGERKQAEVEVDARSESSAGSFQDQYKAMRKLFKSALLAERELMDEDDDCDTEAGRCQEKPEREVVLRQIDRVLENYPESTISKSSRRSSHFGSVNGSMWLSPRSQRTPRSVYGPPSACGTPRSCRSPRFSGRGRSRHHSLGSTVTQTAAEQHEWAGLVPRVWSKDRLDILHKEMEAERTYPIRKDSKEEIQTYQQLMRDRLQLIGAEGAQEEQWPPTRDASEAVKACVRSYHQACNRMEMFHGYTAEDARPEGLEKPEKMALAGFIRALSTDPDLPRVVPNSRRPQKKAAPPSPLRRRDSAGTVGMRLMRVMRFIRALPRNLPRRSASHLSG